MSDNYDAIDYDIGVADGLQRALDIVNNASDWLQQHPRSGLDTFDVLARIITDIQVAGNKEKEV